MYPKQAALFVVAFLVMSIGLFVVPHVFADQDASGQAVKAEEITVDASMTLADVSALYGVPLDRLAAKFDVRTEKAGRATIGELGLSPEKVREAVRKYLVHRKMEASKDWTLIFAKFALWILCVAGATLFLVGKKVTARGRLIYMIAGVLVFGVAFGPDPNPMGTVKDAVVLYAREDMVFPPRLIAMCVFLLMVLVSNKSICGWGCQFGLLQDVLGRIGPKKKPRLPFWLTNTVRAAVFVIIPVVAFIYLFDFVGEVDPFRVFRLDFTTAALVFIPLVLIVSIFYYRPWCQLACPFGFLGWLVEQVSVLRPRINPDKCVECELCTVTCPTQAMRGIYDKAPFRADCFACSDCINACPTDAIRWGRRV